MKTKGRLHSLDYLRGLAACGIMVFHLKGWLFGEQGIDAFIERVGIYGVSLFYVLSGLTLAIVNREAFGKDGSWLSHFIRKRILRIFPLLWLTILSTIILAKQLPTLSTLILNISGTFGFLSWDSYIVVGSWSIGNELVFYAFFPLMMYLFHRQRVMFYSLMALFMAFYLFFAFHVIDPGSPLASQWRNYVNPLNQVFLFAGGFLIGVFNERVRTANWQMNLLAILVLATFIFYPVSGDAVQVTSGIPRIVFTLLCFLLCFAFIKTEFKLPRSLHAFFAYLGEASYSIYLLHPLVYSALSILMVKMRLDPLEYRIPFFAVNIVLTLLAGGFTYRFFESRFIKMARSKKER